MIAVRPTDIETGPRREVTLQAAVDGLDAIVAEATAGEDAVITPDGRPEAMVVPWAAWDGLSRRISFGALPASSPLADEDIAPRHRGPVHGAEL